MSKNELTYGEIRLKIEEAIKKYKSITNNILTGEQCDIIDSEFALNNLISSIYNNIETYNIEEQKEIIKYLEMLKNMMNSPSDIETAIDSVLIHTIPQFDLYSIKNEDYKPDSITENKISDVKLHVLLWRYVREENGSITEYDHGIKNINGEISLKNTEDTFIINFKNCYSIDPKEVKYLKRSEIISKPYLERAATVFFTNSKQDYSVENDWLKTSLYFNKKTFDSETGEYEREYINTFFNSWEIDTDEGYYRLPEQSLLPIIKIYPIEVDGKTKLFTKLKIRYSYKGYLETKELDIFNEKYFPDFELNEYSKGEGWKEKPVYIEVIDERFSE